MIYKEEYNNNEQQTNTIVTATTPVPYDWLRRIPRSLLESDEVPILSTPGPFPWDKFTAFLVKTFQLDKLSIKTGQWESRSSEDFLKGIGSHLHFVNVELSPVQGKITWAIPEQDLRLLMSLILTKESGTADIIEKEYIEGFFEFVVLEALLALNRSEYDKGLVPHILDTQEVPTEGGLCLDVSIKCNEATFIGRLILSEEFRHSWKDRYTQHKVSIDLSTELTNKLQLAIHLEAGRTELSLADWTSIQNGDYLTLDTCSFEPGTDKGRIMLTLNGLPLFRAKLKQGSIKILEFPLYHEVETKMSKDNEDDDMDDYFDDSELEETGEFHEDDDEEHNDLSTDDHSIGDEETPAPIKKEPAAPAKEAPTKAETVAQPPQETPLSPENIQMTIIVEVGRLQMSMQKLLELQPGNLLDLDIHPENGVDLIVNGRCVGRGELLRIGDTLGVRILDKG